MLKTFIFSIMGASKMKKENKEVRLNVRMTVSEYEQFKVYANELGISVSELMRQAVHEKKKTYCMKSLERFREDVDLTTKIDWLNAKS